MHAARRTDERDEARALRVYRRSAGVGVPPVVDRKERERRGQRAVAHGLRAGSEREDEKNEGETPHVSDFASRYGNDCAPGHGGESRSPEYWLQLQSPAFQITTIRKR